MTRRLVEGLGPYGLSLPLRDTRPAEPPLPPRKERAPCCAARRDSDGRLPIGFCSPACIRRPAVWAKHLDRQREARNAAARERRYRDLGVASGRT